MNSNQAPIQSLVNGIQASSLSLLDRSIAYGDGVFRTFPVIKGAPQSWEMQYKKLHDDCLSLNISCPNAQILLRDIQTLFANDDGVAKIIITRGESDRGYTYQDNIQPNRILTKARLPQYPERNVYKGVRLHLCQLRLSHQPKLAGIKHLNRLENVIARHEWSDADIVDGVLLDQDGKVIECTMSNLFARVGSQLLTPLLDKCGVTGVTRGRVIAKAPHLNLAISEENMLLDQLMQAEEVLICNSLFGVWQVTEFNGHKWAKQSLADELNSLLKAG